MTLIFSSWTHLIILDSLLVDFQTFFYFLLTPIIFILPILDPSLWSSLVMLLYWFLYHQPCSSFLILLIAIIFSLDPYIVLCLLTTCAGSFFELMLHLHPNVTRNIFWDLLVLCMSLMILFLLIELSGLVCVSSIDFLEFLLSWGCIFVVRPNGRCWMMIRLGLLSVCLHQMTRIITVSSMEFVECICPTVSYAIMYFRSWAWNMGLFVCWGLTGREM